MENFLVGNLLVSERDLAALNASGGFDDYQVVRLELDVFRVKVVNLSDLFKSYSDYFCHTVLLYCAQSHVETSFSGMF